MRILLSTYGSRGDVEPVVALGERLQALGAEVRVSVPGDEEFAALCARAGVPLVPAFAPVREWAKEMIRRSAAASPESRAKLISGQAAEILVRQYDALMAAAEGCDAVVACGLSRPVPRRGWSPSKRACATSSAPSVRSGCRRRITGRMSIRCIRFRQG
ncbi:glycosyltransferase [Mesorhizobium dulcispinae]|uniref:glycosyltransferase n=1 Tax=Mesorhizobium dulcispinae TaxID=3072316 RepID=UPI002A23D55D|nr:glycosyltransferase [Mesorhizobium sp. VK23D]MDX8517363.1 glycosyltransferase [Mesorhizobium sp. VK23D]